MSARRPAGTTLLRYLTLRVKSATVVPLLDGTSCTTRTRRGADLTFRTWIGKAYSTPARIHPKFAAEGNSSSL